MKRKTSMRGWRGMYTAIAIYAAITVLSFILIWTFNHLLWYMVLVLGLGLVFLFHSKSFEYSCPYCREKFRISLFSELFRPDYIAKTGGLKYLSCPHCNQKGWFEIEKKRLLCDGKNVCKIKFR